MNKNIFSIKYNYNNDRIKKLERKLKRSSKLDKEEIRKEILAIEREQLKLTKVMRKSLYANFSKEDLLNNDDSSKKEIVYEKDDVYKLISEVEEVKEIKEPKIIELGYDKKDINELNNDILKNDDPTDVLSNKPDLTNLKIIFDGKYKIIYNNGKNTFEKDVDDEIIKQNNADKTFLYDVMLIEALKEFDEKYKTKLHDQYMENNIDVIYDFSKIKKYNKTIKKIRKAAKIESDKHQNVTVKDKEIYYRVKKSLLTVAALGVGVLSIFQLGKDNKKENTINKASTTTEATTEEITTEATTKEITTEVTTEATTEKITTEETVVEEKETTKEEVKVEEDIKEEVTAEEESLKIGDTFYLGDNSNIDFYEASTDIEPVGNSNSITGDYKYQIQTISVVYNNQSMELVYNESINISALEEICKEKYGDDVQIFLNCDLLDGDNNIATSRVAWINNDDIKNLTLK